MKIMIRTILLLMFMHLMTGCEEGDFIEVVETNGLETKQTVEKTDEEHVEKVEVVTKDDVIIQEKYKKYYLELTKYYVEDYKNLMQSIREQQLEVLGDSSLVDDDKWLNELIEKYEQIGQMYYDLDSIDDIPVGLEEFHLHVKLVMLYTYTSKETTISGIKNMDKDMLDKSRELIEKSGEHLEEAIYFMNNMGK